MASPDWQQEVLSPEHGVDVSPGLPAAYVLCRIMDWELIKPISGVILGKIGVCEAFTVGYGRDVLGLQPGLVKAEYPKRETPQLAATFI